MKPLDPELISALAEQTEAFGPIWSGPAKNLAAFAAELGSEAERRRSFQRALEAGYFTQFTAYSDPQFIARVVDWQWNDLQASGLDVAGLPAACVESALVRGATIVKRGNREVSPDFLRYLAYAALLQKHAILDQPRPRVLEIGSGYGGMARVFKKFVPDATIVLTDLTPSLIYAHLFLGAEFPQARIIVAREGDDPAVWDGADFVLVPAHRAGCLRHMNIDLAMNIWSFGEIPNALNRRWFDKLQNDLSVSWLFLINSFLKRLGPQSANELDFGKWLPLLDARWQVEHFEIDPRMHRCPYVMNFPSGAAVLARRIDAAAEIDRESRKTQEEFDGLLCADWISPADTLDATASERFIALSHHVGQRHLEPGRSGPFFRLWQQYRLNQDPRALRLLLAYLRIIRGSGGDSFRFKEEFYFHELLSANESARARAAFFRAASPIVLALNVQEAFEHANELRKGQGLAAAQALYEKILEACPGHAESHFALGQLAEWSSNDARALYCYQSAEALCPGHPSYVEALHRMREPRRKRDVENSPSLPAATRVRSLGNHLKSWLRAKVGRTEKIRGN